jgi:hypothetical protein
MRSRAVKDVEEDAQRGGKIQRLLQKKIFPATQNSEFGRELTNGNSLSPFGKQEIRILFRFLIRLAQNKP